MKSQLLFSFLCNKSKLKKNFFRSLFSREKKELDVSNCECYVLIKCAKPSPIGDMNVEMTYEGDASLAGYLVENASQIFSKKTFNEEIYEAY